MSVNSAAHSVNGGFNQSGGAHFIVITDIAGKLYAHTPGTGSGGAAGAGTVALVTPAALAPGVGSTASVPVTTLTLGPGKLIKDMGKTIVVPLASSPEVKVTYRKFQAVVAPSATGAGGQTGVSPQYVSFYLEVGRDGAQNTGPAGIARYF